MTRRRTVRSLNPGSRKGLLRVLSRTALGFALLLLAWGSQATFAAERLKSEDTDIFLAGVRAYDSAEYEGAIEAFSALATRGYESGWLYFNLGNSYLKSGNLGHAILWYERALKVMPDNADLLYNLDYARALTRDEIENPEVPLGRIVFFWNYRMPAGTVRGTALFFWLAFWSLLALKRFSRGSLIRVGIILSGFLGFLFVVTAFYNYYDEAFSKDAIILADEVTVRSGTDAVSTELFRLHAGTRVEARRMEGGYALVSFAKDRVGWVPGKNISLVRGP